MDCIVNNTGIPTSEWSKYRPAGTESPTLDFAALAKAAGNGGGELQDIVSKLSDSSRTVLKRLKNHPDSISKMEWMNLTHELNQMGVLSDSDYTQTRVSFRLVPLGDMDNPYTSTEDFRSALTQLEQWPANPFEQMDLWAFSLRKWASELSMERNPDGTPKYRDLSPIQNQASACDRVSGLVKELMGACDAQPPASAHSLARSGGSWRDSAFHEYLDVEVQRKKMQELLPGQMLPSAYLQFKEDYERWKAQQPEISLPDSQGWTSENLAFLREHYGEDLSAFEIYDVLDAMESLGMISEKCKNSALGSYEVRLNLSDSGLTVAHGVDFDSRAAWLHGLDEAPMNDFHSLDDILSWTEAFREEDYPNFITLSEMLARGWV